MEVNFYATLRPIVGQKTIEFSVPDGLTVGQLIQILIQRFPILRNELLDEEGDLYRHVHVFVNGRDVPYLEEASETRISASDKLDIFPAVGGG
jgi:molybdopterin synthase sulfur carrier subunit